MKIHILHLHLEHLNYAEQWPRFAFVTILVVQSMLIRLRIYNWRNQVDQVLIEHVQPTLINSRESLATRISGTISLINLLIAARGIFGYFLDETMFSIEMNGIHTAVNPRNTNDVF
ncbi:hypothetical protein DERF_013296 [Dermatophagoides farinae]|uniref:Uncharacterized protein n=1 Tax=Dermatophagoides farinae TaxID=6954 RepID=A0A922HLV4_DERFA|nr:hypothetical protein DERF_013296 [Dermatophagoides farinae]